MKYLGESYSLAKNLENRFIDIIESSKQFVLYTADSLHYYSMLDSSLNINNIENAVKTGTKLGVDIVIVGKISEYNKNEVYLGFVERDTYTADEYEKSVSFNFSLEIYSVKKKNIIFREEKMLFCKDTGHRNVRRIPEPEQREDENSSFSSFFGGLINTVLGGPYKLDSYNVLQQSCINQLMQDYAFKLLKHQEIIKEKYIKDSDGGLQFVTSYINGRTTNLNNKNSKYIAK